MFLGGYAVMDRAKWQRALDERIVRYETDWERAVAAQREAHRLGLMLAGVCVRIEAAGCEELIGADAALVGWWRGWKESDQARGK